MKFQIILEATDKKRALMADDEFTKLVKQHVKVPGFKIAHAMSLEGIRPETWQPPSAPKVVIPARTQVVNKMLGKKPGRTQKDPLE